MEVMVLKVPQLLLELKQQTVRGHLAAGEEVLGHPVVLTVLLEGIEVLAVGEDMHEEGAAGLEPTGDAPEEFLVVAHVFEHFDAYDAIKDRAGVEVQHVGCADLEVAVAETARLRVNIRLLRA